MAIEASSTEPENKKRNKDDEWRRVAIVLLFLLLSFICIFCSSQGALYYIDRDKIIGNMRSALQADYELGVPVVFPRVNLSSIVPEIIGDDDDLQATPEAFSGGIAILPQAVAQIPAPTPTPILPTSTSTSTPTPTPTSTPTSSPSEDTAQPSPTSPPPTSPPPTATSPPPTSPPPTATSLPPTSPPPTSPPPTSPPPTSPPPTSPPPTSPPPTSPPPTPTNAPPVAVDDPVTTDEDVAIVIAVLANDSDSDGTLIPSSVTVTSGPANGTYSVNTTTGEITYMPNSNFSGIDTFIYQVCDDGGACATATVTVTVNPINDPPTVVDDTAITYQDVFTVVNVIANDSDIDGTIDPATVAITTGAPNGLAVAGPGVVTYTPNSGFSGVDTFGYQVCDTGTPPPPLCGTATVTVTVIDTAPTPPTIRAAPGDSKISLGWDPAPEVDVVGYNIYRDDGTGYSLISTTMVITKYFDLSVSNGTTYAYTVTAIDAGSNESMPSNIASATPALINPTATTPVTCGGTAVTNCGNADGTPDNNIATITGTGYIIFDFDDPLTPGITEGIIDGPNYDMVFYELYDGAPPPIGINMDLVTIEVSTDGSTWYTVFNWDGILGGVSGTNIDSFAADGETEDEFIDEGYLYPPLTCGIGPPAEGCHGIAIDIGVFAPSGNAYRYVRFTDPDSTSPGAQQAEVDALERLN